MTEIPDKGSKSKRELSMCHSNATHFVLWMTYVMHDNDALFRTAGAGAGKVV